MLDKKNVTHVFCSQKLRLILFSLWLLNTSALWAKPTQYDVPITVENTISKDIGTDYTLAAVDLVQWSFDLMGVDKPSILNSTLQGYLGFYIALMNHEIIGHTFSGHDVGWDTSRYTWRPFSAATYIKMDAFIQDVQQDTLPTQPIFNTKDAIVSLGGIQASRVLANKQQVSYLLKGMPRGHVRHLSYLYGSLDRLTYIYLTPKDSTGNDIHAYADNMAQIYGVSKKRVLNKMANVAWIDLINPVLWFNLNNLNENKTAPVPMMNLGDVDWLPWLAADFTPFGYGVYFNNYVKVRSMLFEVNVGSGTTYHDKSYYAIHLNAHHLLKLGDLSLSLLTQFWRQPQLLTKDPLKAPFKHGLMAFLKTEYQVNDVVSFILNVGYKTQGYLMDESKDQTALVRGGIALRW